VSVGDLKTGGSDYRSIDLHLVVQDGKLRLDPLSANLPEGRLDASLSVDATAPAPPVALTLHAPGLEVAPLLAAAGLPGYAKGKLEVYADLHGAGDTPHAIAAGLDGSLGLAMQNGTMDTQLLDRLLGGILQKANLLGLLSHGGSNDLRCFALRADVQHGVAELRALDLNSSVLSMDGTGRVNLGDETLALQLRPQGRLANTVIVVPLRVTGPIRSPEVVVNAIGAAESNAGTVAGAVIGGATPLGLLGGMLGGGKLSDARSADACAGPLALARGQAIPAATAPSAQTQPKSSGSGALLHDLFH
jgi:AsmA protein